MRWYHHDRLKAMLGEALGKGATRLAPTTWEWDISGDCEKPHLTEMRSRPDPRTQQGDLWKRGGRTLVVPDDGHTIHCDLWTRCRKCPRCLDQRRKLWAARARQETKTSSRTWFGTLTLSPEEQALALYRGQRYAKSRGLEESDDILTRHRGVTPDLSRYLKRLRKESGARFRYLLVCEAHKSGMPHYHMLVHEQSDLYPIREAVLSHQWKLGFCRWRLVKDATQAAYLTKYLSKSAQSRVRASQHYGGS